MNDTILNRLLGHLQTKGIIVSDVKRFTWYVTHHNYNRAMKPYLKFISNKTISDLQVTSDDLINLYELDNEISVLFLTHILEIEKKLNTQIAYTIEDTFKIYDGCLFKLDKSFIMKMIFPNATMHGAGISFDQLINKLTKYAHINPNTNMYEDVSKNNLFQKWKVCPLDALCLSWTFNTTVLAYYSLNDQLKRKIIRFFKLSPNKIDAFNDSIDVLVWLRNAITHNNVMLEKINELNQADILKTYNSIFNARKQIVTFSDLAGIVQFFSGKPTLIDDLATCISKYKFSSDKIQARIDNVLMDKPQDEN